MRQAGKLVLAALVVIVIAGCDWSQVGYGPTQAKSNPFEPALTTSSLTHLASVWSSQGWTESCNCSYFDPLVASNALYATRFRGEINPLFVDVVSRDATTGADRWTTSLGSIEFAFATAVGNGLVYVHVSPVDAPDELVALDAATGAQRWSLTPPALGTGTETMAGSNRSPGMVLDGTTMFVTASAGGAAQLSAVDPTGQVLWTTVPAGGLVDGVAANGNGTLYVASTVTLTNPPDGAIRILTGYSEASGAVTSRVVMQTQTVGVPAFANGLVYVGGTAIRPGDGSVAWSAPGRFGAVSASAIVLFDDTTVTARDPMTGAVLWSAPKDEASHDTVAIAGGFVYLGGPQSLTVRVLTTGDAVASIPLPDDGIEALIVSAGHVLMVNAGFLWSYAPTSG
jgi:hypothetical protein